MADTQVSLRDFIEQRFDSLDDKIDTQCEQVNGVLNDHEDRLRHLEKQSPWKWIAHSVTGALAAVGIYLGTK